MAHNLTGSFAIGRLSEEARKELDAQLETTGVKKEYSPNGLNVTLTGDRESFDFARAKYNSAIARAAREQKEASPFPAEDVMQSFEERAAQRADRARQFSEGSLMSNPPQMAKGAPQNNEGEKREQLPANSPPPGFDPHNPGEATEEYVQAMQEIGQAPEQQGQGEYVPPQPANVVVENPQPQQ